MSNEFENDLAIDPEQLDLQAVLQPELFFKWAEKAVKARERSEQKKFTLDILTAELSSKARIDPESFSLVKVTEASIQEAVKTNEEYIEAYEEYIEARTESNLMDKAVEALEQKKRMIESLITLHGQQYFAGPSVPRSLVEVWKNAKEKKSEEVRSKIKIRKRN